MRCLVTGGAGFIGSALVRALLRQGERVRVLDNFLSGRAENLPAPAPDDALEVLEGDLLHPAQREAALRDVEVVFHLAARVSVPASLTSPAADLATNIQGTLALLESARQAGVRRLVYAGSAAVYGDAVLPPVPPTSLPSPQSPYAVSKYAGELYAQVYARAWGLEVARLRFFNVYGPRQDPRSPYSGVLSRFLSALAEDSELTIYGDGLQTRDFVFVDDVVQACLAAARVPAAALPQRALNIGTGVGTSLLSVLNELSSISGRRLAPPGQRITSAVATSEGAGVAPPRLRFEPPRPGDIRHSWADISETRRVLGYAPAWTLRDGLAHTWAWYRQHAERARLAPARQVA